MKTIRNSLILIILFCGLLVQSIHAQYSWQKKYAKVSPEGKLEWQPEPFVYSPGSSIKYIDYETGDDNNSGTSKTAPWKHHPWDPAATGVALSTTGIHTYVFKRGVIYRGSLVANASGVAGNPIKLTSDPSWGTGEAMFFGSTRIAGGWTQCNATTAPKIPNPTSVYYIDIDNTPYEVSPSIFPSLLCETDASGNIITRIPVARSPNWTITDRNDPLRNWAKLTSVGSGGGYTIGVDASLLNATTSNYYLGGYRWQEYGKGSGASANMGTTHQRPIEYFDPAQKAMNVHGLSAAGNRYFIENLPQLLDAPGEFYYDKTGSFPGRLYIRMPNDANPNTKIVEIVSKQNLILFPDIKYIEVSGLTFKFNMTRYDMLGNDVANFTLFFRGKCGFITVKNNKFEYLESGLTVANDNSSKHVMESVVITDNVFQHMDNTAIFVSTWWVWGSGDFRYSEIFDVSILRNKLYDIGGRQKNRDYGAIPGIWVDHVQTGEVAGNILEYCWGAGVYTFWGKQDGNAVSESPLIRGLVFQNRVDTSLLATNDWGGIETWQGGPVYEFSNISRNARGYRNQLGNTSTNYAPWGGFYYLDGAYKNYLFNNLAIGLNNDLSDQRLQQAQVFQMVYGVENKFINNSVYKVTRGSQMGSGVGVEFVGNAFEDVTQNVFGHDLNSTGSVAQNVLFCDPVYIGSGSSTTLAAYQSRLATNNLKLSSVGIKATSKLFENGAVGDFRPTTGSPLIDQGVKYFIPWSLYATVGEWDFTAQKTDATVIRGQNWYMTSQFGDRGGYQTIPTGDLKANNATVASYVYGNLEDWNKGALQFNGTNVYCSATDGTTDGSKYTNVEVTTGSFIMEIYLKPNAGITDKGLICNAASSGNGYVMDIDNAGKVKVALRVSGADAFAVTSAAAINDGNWHHVLAEVDRAAGIKIWVDGVLSNGTSAGSMTATSLDNSADFWVGRNYGDKYFAGLVDFVRIAKGTFAQSRTTFEELYAWQFDGPVLKDFSGNPVTGSKRDAGAIEYGASVYTCNVTLTPATLSFTTASGSKTTSVALSGDCTGGVITVSTTSSWLTPSVSGNTVTVAASVNSSFARTGTVSILVDGTVVKTFTVSQDGIPVNLSPQIDTPVDVSYTPDQTGLKTINLTGISDGDGGTQTLTVIASSSNTALIPLVNVNYTSGSTGSVSFTPATGVTGTSTISITVQDNGGVVGGGIDTKVVTFIVSVSNPYSTTFCEKSGEVVIEAENYTSTALNGDLAGTNWVENTAFSGYSGTGYMGMPDAGLANAASWAASSDLSYDITFTTTGTYNIWLYRYSPDGDSDSGNIGIDGVQLGGAISNGTGSGLWGWNMHATTFTVVAAGEKTLNIRRREDGYSVDKIIITKSATTPTGNAQAETRCIIGGTNNADLQQISIYPNPMKNTLNIIGMKEGAYLQVFNTSSIPVISETITGSNYSLDTSHLSNGLYLVRLYNDKGTVKTIKIMKQ